MYYVAFRRFTSTVVEQGFGRVDGGEECVGTCKALQGGWRRSLVHGGIFER